MYCTSTVLLIIPGHGDFFTMIANKFAEINDAVGALVEELKAQGVWDETLLLQQSEFGRTMVHNGMGSDHGWGVNERAPSRPWLTKAQIATPRMLLHYNNMCLIINHKRIIKRVCGSYMHKYEEISIMNFMNRIVQVCGLSLIIIHIVVV